jgi:hypothetical protein
MYDYFPARLSHFRYLFTSCESERVLEKVAVAVFVIHGTFPDSLHLGLFVTYDSYGLWLFAQT